MNSPTALKLEPAPAELRAACKGPVPKPAVAAGGGLSQQKLEAAWKQDRASLRNCGARQKALVGYYNTRDRRLGGNK